MAEQNKSILPLAALALLLMLASGIAVWILTQQDAAPVNTPQQDAVPGQPVADNPVAPVAPPREAPDSAPAPEAPEGRGAVALPPLTRFRALVMEADAALLAANSPEPGSDEAWRACSLLDQLKSPYAGAARLIYDGRTDGLDLAGLRHEIRQSFTNPDVASDTFKMHEGERVALWVRKGVTLPEPELEAPPEVNVPLFRRLQERVEPGVAASWLAAIENDFGIVPYGRKNLPLDIVILADEAEYLSLARKRLRLDVPYWSAGFYSSRWQVICMPVLHNVSLAEVVRHEMFHSVQALLAPESLLVPWFAEGTAEWLDKAPPAGGVVRTDRDFNESAWGYLGSLMESGLEVDLRQLMAFTMAEFYGNPQLNYLLAYCWVDFVRTEEDLRPLYFEFWDLLKQGVGRQQAYARTFGALNFDDIHARFNARAKAAKRSTSAPRFTFDAHESSITEVPAVLNQAPGQPDNPDAINAGWYGVMSELQRRGFDTSRAAPLESTHDLLVVAIDSSESMAGRIEQEWFDWTGFSHWCYAMQASGSLTFNRAGSDTSEKVPPAVRLAMVEAVLTDRVEAFTDASGVRVDERLQREFSRGYERFQWKPDELKKQSRRGLCLIVAQCMAHYLAQNKEGTRVVVADFNSKLQLAPESSTRKIRLRDPSVLGALFKESEGNAAPLGSDGTDCDWWIGLLALTKASAEHGATKPALLFFTDSPNCAGAYGFPMSGRGAANYLRQQEIMGDDYALQWAQAGLTGSAAVLQFFVLPGAEDQGLPLVAQRIAQSRVDTWSQHFRK